MMEESRETLVRKIEQRVRLSPAIRAAFLSVDRRWFVPRYYTHAGKEWINKDARDVVYTDQALVTQLDSHGWASSSSSMPSVMATMLEALNIQQGQRVLEIGSGTGYNAALMAILVGETAQVVSIDLDQLLVEEALVHLAQTSFTNVEVYQADGFFGYPARAPYDRIIATAGFRQVPIAWKNQLVAEGVLVGNLIGSLCGVLIRLVLDQKNVLAGNILPSLAWFMEMRPGLTIPPHIPHWEDYDAQHVTQIPVADDLAGLFENWTFLFYLQCTSPTLQRHMRYMGGAEQEKSSFETWIIDPYSASSIVMKSALTEGWCVQERGTLWNHVLQTYHHWLELGSPALDTYHIEMLEESYVVSLGTERWMVSQQ